MTEFKRINAKKLLVTYKLDEELTNEMIHTLMLSKGKLEIFKIVRDNDIISVYITYDKKVNVTSRETFQIIHNNKLHVATVASFKPTPIAVNRKPNKNFNVSKTDALRIITRALTDREDEVYQTILKEDPNYNLMQALDLSHYHVISIIICGLHTDKEFQDVKIETMRNRLYYIPYLNFNSEEELKQSVMNLNATDTTNLLNIYRGVE